MILLDEMHLSVYVPARLREAECQTIRRVLRSQRFQSELSQLLRDHFRRWPELAFTRTTITR
jgi:hypothetical protein